MKLNMSLKGFNYHNKAPLYKIYNAEPLYKLTDKNQLKAMPMFAAFPSFIDGVAFESVFPIWT